MEDRAQSYIGRALLYGEAGLLTVSLSSLLILLVFVTLSIEVSLTISVSGFNVRPVYFCMGGFIVLNMRYLYYGSKWMPASVFALICVVLSVLQGIRPLLSLAHALLATFTIAFGVIATGYLYQRNRKVLEWWVDLYIFSGVLTAVYSILEFCSYLIYPQFATWWIGPIPRVSALTYEPSYLAFFLAPIFFLSFALRRYRAAAVIILATLLSTSRTGLVGLVGGIAALIVVRPRDFRRLLRTMVKYAAIIAIGLLALPSVQSALGQFIKFVVSGFTLTDVGSVQARLLSWLYALQLFLDNPVFGVGIMGYGPAMHARGLFLDAPAKEVRTTNLYLEILAELGGLGFTAFMWWVLSPVIRLWKHRRRPHAAGLIAAMTSMIAMFPFIQTWWRPYLWTGWILAYALAAQYRGHDDTSEDHLSKPGQ